MKRYISSILIPCLLMQFFGCTSSREISLEELSNSEDAIITTKDSNKYHLKKSVKEYDLYRDIGVYFSDDWLIQPDNEMIVLCTQRAYKEVTLRADQEDRRNPEELVIKEDTTIINYEDISNISVEFVDEGKTFLFVVLSLIAIAGIVAAIQAATFKLDFSTPGG